MSVNIRITHFRQFSSRIILNEVNIPMISRSLQKTLFGISVDSYSPAPASVINNLSRHGIDIKSQRSHKTPVDFPIPSFLGSNVSEHMDKISHALSAPYIELLNSFFFDPPSYPSSWSSKPGYYSDGTFENIAVPDSNVLIFDTEVLVIEGNAPKMAVALSSHHWYSWTSPKLKKDEDFNNSPSDSSLNLEDLIPFRQDCKDTKPKCIIGHFISYDRSRIADEYFIKDSGIRFLDTMALHISVSGLTSTQRYLKTSASKHNFNNKVWKDYVRFSKQNTSQNNKSPEEASMNLDWIPSTSLNNLYEVYKLYCEKEPPQDKSKRDIFVTGSRKDVIDDFQNLMTYCATDVLMTFSIFQKLFPLFRQRFPHPATLFGMLEMGSMYLPISSSWLKYIDRSEEAFNNFKHEQKEVLMGLADEALKKFQHNDQYKKDPWLWDLDWSKPKKPLNVCAYRILKSVIFYRKVKWYRELIPKPIKENLDKRCSLITSQMRLAPKLLRLCWQGIPLHYDSILKWGFLIPGKAPKPFGDPQYYEYDSKTGQPQLHDNIPVRRTSSTGEEILHFPYASYLQFWSKEMRRRIKFEFNFENLDSKIQPDDRDIHLLEEFKRSVDVMPLENTERIKLVKSLTLIKELASKKSKPIIAKIASNTKATIHEHLGEMQVKGVAFWKDANRYSVFQPVMKLNQKISKQVSMTTVNPDIPTCWFSHLPHESGYGNPVGNPLSKSFQIHIQSGRLHSELSSVDKCDVKDMSKWMLDTQIKTSFWQGYSKRIKICYLDFSQPVSWTVPFKVKLMFSDLRQFWHIYSDLTRGQILVWTDETLTQKFGAILPQVVTTGTVTRRAVEPLWLTASNAESNRLGSELKAMVQTPAGYRFVGADVDSQEMWIASLIGDSSVGFQGGTPYGWMTLEGNKAEGTDLHTKVAQMIGISRDQAKVLNYARLYGSGFEFTSVLLSRFSTDLTPEEARKKADLILRQTKGQRISSTGTYNHIALEWKNGSESEVFNQLESIAKSPNPKTPVLQASMTRALNPKLVKDDFLPSRINWVVQSSAVDYLHCLLVCMRWLLNQHKIDARLCISIHDEVKYICREEDCSRVALSLQISNLITRSFFAYQLGMRDLPESVAFFSSVEIDTCLRKSAKDNCVTPSNPEGLTATYNIPKGDSYDIEEILEWSKRSLDKPKSSLNKKIAKA